VAIHRLVTATLHGRAWHAEASKSATHGGSPAVDRSGSRWCGAYRSAESIGWAIARAAAELLAQAAELRLRECGRANCTRIFDRSRTGSRRAVRHAVKRMAAGESAGPAATRAERAERRSTARQTNSTTPQVVQRGITG
jgi:predicted RNA-binding Zn ribbon-like protein